MNSINSQTISDYEELLSDCLLSGDDNLANCYRADIEVAKQIYSTISVRELFLIYFLRSLPLGRFNNYFHVVQEEANAISCFNALRGQVSSFSNWLEKRKELHSKLDL